MIQRLSQLYGLLLQAMSVAGCHLLLAMMVTIVVDVLLRNIEIIPSLRGLAWSNEISELMLYFITMLVAPWLLRQGQHIRVDILLQAIPPRTAWMLECLADFIGLCCCITFAYYGAQAAWSSFQSGAVTIKTLVTPEWWSLAPLPIVFTLLSIEMLFRMHRLWLAEREPRNDAVSAA